MSEVWKRKISRNNSTDLEGVIKYRWCRIDKYRVFIGICEERCTSKKCPISADRVEKERKKKAKTAEKIRRKKLDKEMKKWDKEGRTRNLLLKPEDRIKEN